MGLQTSQMRLILQSRAIPHLTLLMTLFGTPCGAASPWDGLGYCDAQRSYGADHAYITKLAKGPAEPNFCRIAPQAPELPYDSNHHTNAERAGNCFGSDLRRNRRVILSNCTTCGVKKPARDRLFAAERSGAGCAQGPATRADRAGHQNRSSADPFKPHLTRHAPKRGGAIKN